MPRYQEEERIYHVGFRDGWRAAMSEAGVMMSESPDILRRTRFGAVDVPAKKKRKASAWNKFVKVNSKKKQFRYANGKVNLKKLGVAWRKKKRGR